MCSIGRDLGDGTSQNRLQMGMLPTGEEHVPRDARVPGPEPALNFLLASVPVL